MELKQQVIDLLAEINKTGRTHINIDMAFKLHEEIFKKKEKRFCGACVNKVLRNLDNFAKQ